METFNGIIQSYTYPLDFTFDYNNSFIFNEEILRPISFVEVFSAIEKSKASSAPGTDSIPYKLLKQLPHRAIHWLTLFYNLVFDTGILPNSWKEYNVSFISKPNSDKFRPIALACTTLKILVRGL